MSFDTSSDNQSFNLYYASGTYAMYTSDDFVSGRKCMEFLWENGTGGYSIGFGSQSIRIIAFMHESKHQLICDLRGNRIRDEQTDIAAKLNTKYMVCINTYESTFLLQIGNQYRYIDYTPVESEKLRIVVKNGASAKRAYVRMFFGNTRFNNTLPPRYSAVIDKDIDYCITCRQSLPFSYNNLFIFLFILD